MSLFFIFERSSLILHQCLCWVELWDINYIVCSCHTKVSDWLKRLMDYFVLYFSHFESKTATFNDDFYQIIWSHLVVPSIDKFTNIFNILVKFDITLQDNLTSLNVTGKGRVYFLLNDLPPKGQTSFQIWRGDKSSRGADCSEFHCCHETFAWLYFHLNWAEGCHKRHFLCSIQCLVLNSFPSQWIILLKQSAAVCWRSSQLWLWCSAQLWFFWNSYFPCKQPCLANITVMEAFLHSGQWVFHLHMVLAHRVALSESSGTQENWSTSCRILLIFGLVSVVTYSSY